MAAAMATVATFQSRAVLDRTGRVKPPGDLGSEVFDTARKIGLDAQGIALDTGFKDMCKGYGEQLATASYTKPFPEVGNKADEADLDRFEQSKEELREANIILANSNSQARDEELKENAARAQAGEEPSASLLVATLVLLALAVLFAVALHDAFFMVDAEWRWPMALAAGVVISAVPVAVSLNKWVLKAEWTWLGLVAGLVLVSGQFIFRYYYAQSDLSPAIAPALGELGMLLFLGWHAWTVEKKFREREPHVRAAEEAARNKAFWIQRAGEYKAEIATIKAWLADFIQYVQNRWVWATNHAAIVTAIGRAAELGFVTGHNEKLRKM